MSQVPRSSLLDHLFGTSAPEGMNAGASKLRTSSVRRLAVVIHPVAALLDRYGYRCALTPWIWRSSFRQVPKAVLQKLRSK